MSLIPAPPEPCRRGLEMCRNRSPAVDREKYFTFRRHAKQKPPMVQVRSEHRDESRLGRFSQPGTIFANAVKKCGAPLDLAKEDLTVLTEYGLFSFNTGDLSGWCSAIE